MTDWTTTIFGLLVFGLLCCIVFQQIFFLRQVQKLIDKVMSRSFQEYQAAVKPREMKIAPQEVPEDLRILQGFQL